MKVTVLIPCYNERATIEEVLWRVEHAPVRVDEILVVDDGSTDGTRDILTSRFDRAPVRLIFHEENRGKGGALRTGFAQATGDVVLVQDADLEYDPADYAALLEPLERGEADAVYGSRFAKRERAYVPLWLNLLGNRVLTWASNRLSRTRLTDMETGYKVIRRELLQDLELVENGFGIEPEITAKLARRKARIVEVPISYRGRTPEEGKKIRPTDGLRALYAIVRYNLF